MSDRYVVTLTTDENNDYRTTLRAVHNGKELLDEIDGGEAEDSSFGRDWDWVPDALRQAYALGLRDGTECVGSATEATPVSKSDDCERGHHERCDGTNLNSPMGCECECHD